MSSSSLFRQSAGQPAPEFSHKRKSSRELHSDTKGVFRRTSTSSRAPGNTSKWSSSRRTGSFIQTLRSGISYENSSLRTKKSNTLRGKIRNTSAENESWACRQFDTKFEPAPFLSRCGNMQKRARVWSFSTEHVVLPTELQSLEWVYHETRNRYSQEVKELKRAKDLRTDEFSRQELRETQFTVNELTAQIQVAR